MQLHLGKGFKSSTKTLFALASRAGKTFEETMIRGQEGDDPVGFAVIGVVEDDGWGNLLFHVAQGAQDVARGAWRVA